MLLAAAVAAAVLAPSANAVGGNSVNPQIAGLQVALRAWGYYNGPVDGIAGPVTAGGLHAFQRRMHLPTGVAERADAREARPARPPAVRLAAARARRASAGTCRCSSSSSGAAGLYNGALDGYLDATTEAALRKFQSACSLAADGVAGRATLAAIATRARVPVRAKRRARLAARVRREDAATR